MPSREKLIVAVDIGGTFTDITLQDIESGKAWTAKTPSTPRDPSEAFLTGVLLALDQAGRAASEIIRVLHGTTVATNLILEGRTAPTALLTTAGFRHVLEIGRADLPRRDNLWSWVKPKRPVPPALVFEAAGRMDATGQELEPLDRDAVRQAAQAAAAAGVKAIAICFLHAFANPDHERKALEILRQEVPNLALSASSDVLPIVREYERSMATVLNVGVMPAVSTYIERLEDRLRDATITAPLLLMKSNGGVAGAAAIRQAPVQTALSGPAAGVVGARMIAEAAGIQDIITVDIGGTSADICLMSKGKIGLTQTGRVGPWPLPLPMIDMVTIGAGGGSIAQCQADGALTVGPQSAGAEPGPASYGRGGTAATVTDAHLVLGHLPETLLGGRMKLDAHLARAAIDRIALPLKLSREDTARGILAIANNNMVGAIRVVSVERGHDPRDFTLVPFGGAGPLHGCALAELLGMSRILVPPSPGVLCAQGLLAADLKSEFTVSVTEALADADWGRIERSFQSLEESAKLWFQQEAVLPQDQSLKRVALMRYEEQGHELAIDWPTQDNVVLLGHKFSAAHKALYGFDLPEVAMEIVTLRLEASGVLPAPTPGKVGQGDPHTAKIGTQAMLLNGTEIMVPVLDRTRLGVGAEINGPAILTQLDTTTLIEINWVASIQQSGSIILTKQTSIRSDAAS
jgi:N-methylhydantoinase A